MATPHISDDGLELHATDKLAEADAVAIKEHLLVYEESRGRLTGWDEYVRAMQAK